MTTAAEDRMAKMRDIVCEILELDPDEVTDDSLFKEDHGADSMGTIEILALLEKEYGVVIDEAELIRMVNLSGVYAVVAEVAGWERATERAS
ncbi:MULTISPECIES: acyl carrier protein [Actinomadura]|jgi:acyl carrier protein|uniref:Acyl carrier protein n=1 Tax=Actinomadura rudentiformis TaxID=359158 RepID=A0A6H9YGS6_9ACTN|nr:acyl carrier protein [Actinomadura rudentiformis]KAB2339673.1 acyl carrier protein [Actinomadura rudentiformis]